MKHSAFATFNREPGDEVTDQNPLPGQDAPVSETPTSEAGEQPGDTAGSQPETEPTA